VDTQEAVLEEATARNFGRPLVATIALSSEVLTREDQIALLLERSQVTEDTMSALRRYDWPGNVRGHGAYEKTTC